MRKVAKQLGLALVKVGRAAMTLPHRYDLFRDLKKTLRNTLRSVSSERGATSV